MRKIITLLSLSKPTRRTQPIETARLGILWAFCLLISSCNAENHITESSEVVSYHYQTLSEVVENDYSPTGEWEIHHRFPVFESAGNFSHIKAMNQAITEKIEDYSCPESGEETFTAEVLGKDGDQVIVEYEAMWMCSSMPSPKHTSGTIDLNLPKNVHFAGERPPE